MVESNNFTFTKVEKVTDHQIITTLFDKSATTSSILIFPLLIKWFIGEPQPSQEGKPNLPQILVSVPKKKLKSSVNRNRVKRLIRESYRLNKSVLTKVIDYQNIYISFVFLGQDTSDFKTIEKSVKKGLSAISKKLYPTQDSTKSIIQPN